jgi:hypothetical protein
MRIPGISGSASNARVLCDTNPVSLARRIRAGALETRLEEVPMVRTIALLLAVSLTVVAPAARAQDDQANEVGLLLGAVMTPELALSNPPGTADFAAGLTFQATYARRLARLPLAQLSLEIPLLAAPSVDTRSTNVDLPSEYASLFITPGLRVKFAPAAPLSPWFSVGGGYARFDEAKQRQDNTPNPGRIGRNTGALQFGGGVDIRTPVSILLPISLRLEVRDVYSGKPTYNTDTGGSFQHNVVFSGGFVVHF